MSNDTDVYATLSSSSPLDVLAAGSYLRNKDRSWRLSVDEVKRFAESERYSIRISGWANENSWNYHITGEEGEMGDLLRKFPGIELEGYYRDEYTSGSLYDGDKSQEFSHNDDGAGRSLTIEVGSFRKLDGGMDSAQSGLSQFLERTALYLNEDGGWSGSTPEDENDAPSQSFSLEKSDLEDEQLCEYFCSLLRSMGAPKDFCVRIDDYYGTANCELWVWGEAHVPFRQVPKDEVDAFLTKLQENLEVTPENLLENLPELNLANLRVTDEDGSNVLHHAAERGLLDQVPDEFLVLEYLLERNYSEESPHSLAHESGNEGQLPEEFRDKEFPRDHERRTFIERLMDNGQENLAIEIARNFPSPLLRKRLDRVEEIERIVGMVSAGSADDAFDCLSKECSPDLCRDLLEKYEVQYDCLGIPEWYSGDQENALAELKFFIGLLETSSRLAPDALDEFSLSVTEYEVHADANPKELRSLLGFLPGLQSLLLGCANLKDLSPIKDLTELSLLILHNSSSLTNLDGLSRLTNIETLQLWGCGSLMNLDALGSLPTLTSLSIEGSPLTHLDILATLPELNNLSINNCASLKGLNALGELKKLDWLSFRNCPSLKNLDVLGELPTLTGLNLHESSSLTNLDALANLPSLTSLSIEGNSLINLDALRVLTNLSILYIDNCPALTVLDALANLPALTELDVSNCQSLANLDVLANLPSLTSLSVEGNSLTNLDALSGLKNLSGLTLLSFASLKNVDALSGLLNLSLLNLHQLPLLANLDGLANLPNLEYLLLDGCESIPKEKIDALKKALPDCEITFG